MATDERLIALKKAYADIILNTAKEAAARIMASERKAQGFERELQLSKDEALRMMLRLKQMMDAKIADAQAMSMSRQNKIDELEAQLQEAEDIVKDLREELREVQSDLEHLRNKKQYSNEQNGFQYTSSAVFPSNGFEYVAANDSINTQFRRNELFRFSDKRAFQINTPAPPVSNLYNGCPELPSIILRSKQPGRYRSGCTHRILASEGNLLNKELPGSKKDKDLSSVLEDKCNGEEVLSEPNNKMGNSGKVIEKETDSQFGVSNPVLSFCTTKKRANRYKTKFLSSFTSSPNQISCSDHDAEVSNTTSHLNSARSDTDADVNPSSASRSSSDTTECGLETTGNGKASTYERNLAVSVGVQNPVNGNTEIMPMQKISISVDTSEAAAGESNLEKLDIVSPLPEINDSVGVQNPVNGNTEMMPMQKISISVDTSEAAAGESNLEKLDIVSPLLEIKDSVGGAVQRQPVNERVIKYTFQRKRKRESLSHPNGDVFLEKHASKRPANVSVEDQLLDVPEEDKLNLIPESSPESQRLAQVANQLLLLSEMV